LSVCVQLILVELKGINSFLNELKLFLMINVALFGTMNVCKTDYFTG